ncbi:MAG: hypothetical protein WDO73_11340 [Ignavibacteriota bacterium]
MLITCLGSKRITSGIQLEGYPESCSIHWRKTPVSRGAMPATDAPDRKRPNGAQPGRRSLPQQGAIAGDGRLLVQGKPDVGGGLPRSVSPKKPGGATPITVNGCPSTISVEPTTEVSPHRLVARRDG